MLDNFHYAFTVPGIVSGNINRLSTLSHTTSGTVALP